LSTEQSECLDAKPTREDGCRKNGKTIQLQTAEVGRLLLFGKTFHFLSSSVAGTSEI
jgi:hypothetical protein